MKRKTLAQKRTSARDRKAFVKAQIRILRAAHLGGPYGQEHLEESAQRRLANLERERRSVP